MTAVNMVNTALRRDQLADAEFDQCPLYSQKRTLVERVVMSALCQKRTFRRLLGYDNRVPGKVAQVCGAPPRNFSAANSCTWPRALPVCRRYPASHLRKSIQLGRCISSLAFREEPRATLSRALSANGCPSGSVSNS